MHTHTQTGGESERERNCMDFASIALFEAGYCYGLCYCWYYSDFVLQHLGSYCRSNFKYMF
jgi:hypothetical protein